MDKNQESDSKILNVEIEPELYKILRQRKREHGINIKDSINNSLKTTLKRNTAVQKLLPNIEFVHAHNGQLVLRDIAAKTYVGIGINEKNKLFCEIDNSETCNHALFAWSLVEIEQLIQNKSQEPQKDTNNLAITKK